MHIQYQTNVLQSAEIMELKFRNLWIIFIMNDVVYYLSISIFAIIIHKTSPKFVSMQNLSPLCLWLCPTSMFEKANPSLKSIFFLSYFKRSIEPECVYAFLLAIQLPSQLIYTWGDHFFEIFSNEMFLIFGK